MTLGLGLCRARWYPDREIDLFIDLHAFGEEGKSPALAYVLLIGSSEPVPSWQQIGNYVGMIPSKDSSGGKQRLGHISKQGNSLLRFLLVEAAQALLAGCDARISELLALRIEKHISEDRSTLFIRQPRGKKGGVKTTLKTDAAFRDIDLHSALAKMLSDYIGARKEGFLLQTRTGNMLSPESFFRNGLATIFKRMGRTRVRFNAFRRFRESVLLRSECR